MYITHDPIILFYFGYVPKRNSCITPQGNRGVYRIFLVFVFKKCTIQLTKLCKHHYFQNIFIISSKKPHTHQQLFPNLSFPAHQQNLSTFSSLQIYLNTPYNEFIQYVVFYIWLLSLSIFFLRFIHFVACINT